MGKYDSMIVVVIQLHITLTTFWQLRSHRKALQALKPQSSATATLRSEPAWLCSGGLHRSMLVFVVQKPVLYYEGL